jgi:lycopene cyclase domain-containing protein
MNPKYAYLLVDLFCLSGPFFLSFHKSVAFYKNFKPLAAGILLMSAVYLPWDILFTHWGIWNFNPKYTMQSRWFLLPIEEWLFFVAVPFACVFTFECLRYFKKTAPSKRFTQITSFSLLAISTVLSVFAAFEELWYTFSATLLCSAMLLFHIQRRSEFLGYFLFAWFILLIPFYMSNGILTGLHFYEYDLVNTSQVEITEAIVRYNNQFNLGIRIWSVPIEDFFYGLAMILLALTPYEYFRLKWKSKTSL